MSNWRFQAEPNPRVLVGALDEQNKATGRFVGETSRKSLPSRQFNLAIATPPQIAATSTPLHRQSFAFGTGWKDTACFMSTNSSKINCTAISYFATVIGYARSFFEDCRKFEEIDYFKLKRDDVQDHE
jgi:hypothetical protein